MNPVNKLKKDEKSILLLAMLPMLALADDVKITTPSLVVKNDTLTLTCQMDFSVVRAGNFQTYAFTPMLLPARVSSVRCLR